ncbi:MAG TPA: dynamin family protein [Puia sp.]|nr:dynamin family protein [Puia sp.]
MQPPTHIALCHQLDDLQQLSGHFADKDFYCELNELRLKLTEEKLNLVVVGLFKRGKSSLVNALLGKDLAPVAVTPLTTVVTSFEYTPGSPHAIIYYKGGQSREEDIDQVVQYISEEENPANIKKVEAVRILHPAIPLLRMVTLIDTPGLGSAFVYNTESTREFIPKMDAALFVLSADLPISQADVDFLEELRSSVPEIIFVLNKKDILEEKDLERLLTHDRKILLEKELIRPEASILSVSARLARMGQRGASGIEGLLSHIHQQMETEKDALLQEVFVKRYGWLYSRLEVQLQLKLQALRTPVNELELKQKRLREAIILLHSQKEEFYNTIRGETHMMQGSIAHAVEEDARGLQQELRQRLEVHKEKLKDPALFQSVQTEFNHLILDRFERRWNELEQQIKKKFGSLLAGYGQRSRSFLNELILHLSSLMGISFDIIAGRFDLDTYSSSYLSVKGASIVSGRLSPFARLLPASKRQNQLQHRLIHHYDAVVVQNASSVIYDLQYRIQESFRKFSTDLESRLKDLVDNMDRLIAETLATKRSHQELVENEIRDVEGRLKKLQNMTIQHI